MINPLERDIEKSVVVHCHKRGLLTYKFTSPAHRGVPDRIILGGNKVMFLELKRAGQTPTALQEREMRRIGEHGGHAIWRDSASTAIEAIDQYFFTQ